MYRDMTDSIQCKALLACFDKLVLALKADPLTIWNELAAKGLFPPPDGQIEAQQLARRVLDVVKVEPSRYDVVLNILSKYDWMKDIIEILQTTFGKLIINIGRPAYARLTGYQLRIKIFGVRY